MSAIKISNPCLNILDIFRVYDEVENNKNKKINENIKPYMFFCTFEFFKLDPSFLGVSGLFLLFSITFIIIPKINRINNINST
ncbi:MAG: hypothetical protein IKE90_04495 [Bacilli bacterium]|nr:hypothetical protein [Bacilli bacterium]